MDDIPTLEKNPTLEKRSLSPVVAFAAASAIGAILIVLLAHRFGLLGDQHIAHTIRTVVHIASGDRPAVTAARLVPVVPPLPEHLPPVDATLQALVEQGVAQLGLKPKTVTLPNEQALEAVTAIKRGDYATAATLTQDVLEHSSLDGWSFTPFNRFIATMTHGNDPALLEHLNEWVKQEPQSALAYLLRSQYYYQTAWVLRGSDVASKVPNEIYTLFEEDLRLSELDIRESIRLNPHIPWSYYRLLCAVSNGNGPEVEDAFQEGIRAYPQYYELYHHRLSMLTPKWGGSVRAMHAFVDKYASKATNRSPLKFLYLQEYSFLVNAAWFDCNSGQPDEVVRCVAATLKSRPVPQDVQDGIMQALNLYKVADPDAFNRAIWSVFGEIASTPGSSAAGFGELLQTAATIMGTDNRLANTTGHNNYVLDDVTAQVWIQEGSNDNADQKYHDALRDIEQTTFSDEAARDEALSTVLDQLVALSRSTLQLTNILIYYDAAVSVGGVNFSSLAGQKCYAYYKMKRWTEAVTECTRVLQTNNHYDDPQYYLGRSYEGLQQWDTALAVYEPVALSSDNSYRVGAAIWMSVDYGHKKDFAGELRSLDEHDFLFDTQLQQPDDLATAYNNRCHALMELGRLQEALDDCNTSLKYGQLPEAIHKQHELLRRLGQN